ncbi:hypothetical protein [Archangium violaceum]|uniref:hypothetical protein n=1 Tax=Archangium violaceum TaxID=83451 RepID=UPI0036DAAB65
MKVLLINHLLIQEGDAYGLIYALQLNNKLNQADASGAEKVYGLFYISGEDFKQNPDYRNKVRRRLDYFKSFGLLGSRFKLALCYRQEQSEAFVVGQEDLEDRGLTLRCLSITATSKLFTPGKGRNDDDESSRCKINPTHVALALTGVENDPSGRLTQYKKDILGNKHATDNSGKVPCMGHYTEALSRELADLLRRDEENRELEIDEVSYAYISKSTAYVGHCIRENGFLTVAKTLRELILDTTQEYSGTNAQFLDQFMETLVKKYIGKREKAHYNWQTFNSTNDRDDFLVILFWIRGAKPVEEDTIFNRGGNSAGKPQHHTNLVLYKYIRALVNVLSNELKVPLLFVPIGDRLEELTINAHPSSGNMTYAKEKQDHNLIEFFYRPEFKNKPMGAQINFLLQLASKYQVVQVGMRSGSMERLMYLGVPTIYFDRTEKMPGLPAPTGATRILNLCGFSDQQDNRPQEVKKTKEERTALLKEAARLKLEGKKPPQQVTYYPRDPEKSKAGLVDHFLKWSVLIQSGAPTIAKSKTSGFPLFFQIENKDTGFTRYSAFGPTWTRNVMEWTRTGPHSFEKGEPWLKTPGSRVDNSITKLMTVLNQGLDAPVGKHEYNLFKKKLLKPGYLRENLVASKKYLDFGALDEQETLKICSMLWFISAVYPSYQDLFAESTTPKDFKLGNSQYAGTYNTRKETFRYTKPTE